MYLLALHLLIIYATPDSC